MIPKSIPKICQRCDKEYLAYNETCNYQQIYCSKKCASITNEPYYVNRKEEMIHLRFNLGWSLQRIGDNYNISRERVRQIIGNTRGALKLMYSDTLRNPLWINNNSDKTNDEIAKELGCTKSRVSSFRGAKPVSYTHLTLPTTPYV